MSHIKSSMHYRRFAYTVLVSQLGDRLMRDFEQLHPTTRLEHENVTYTSEIFHPLVTVVLDASSTEPA